MSSLTHIFGEDANVRIACSDDDETIWIRSDSDSVSLTLEAHQLNELEAAIVIARHRLGVSA